MQVYMLDSREEVPSSLWQVLARRVTFLQHPLHTIPIYLVKPATLDSLSLPYGLDTEAFCNRKEIIEKAISKCAPLAGTSLDECLQNIQKELAGCFTKPVEHIAYYVRDVAVLPANLRNQLRYGKRAGFFVSPERLSNIDPSLRELGFLQTFLHLLVQAYSEGDLGWKAKCIDRSKIPTTLHLLEEGLFAAIALLHFEPAEQGKIFSFLQLPSQPAERLCAKFWLDIFTDKSAPPPPFPPGYLLYLWKKGPSMPSWFPSAVTEERCINKKIIRIFRPKQLQTFIRLMKPPFPLGRKEMFFWWLVWDILQTANLPLITRYGLLVALLSNEMFIKGLPLLAVDITSKVFCGEGFGSKPAEPSEASRGVQEESSGTNPSSCP